jgi:hypothetical protein
MVSGVAGAGPPASRPAALAGRTLLWAATAAVGGYLSLFRGAIIDDAYITVTNARTLAESGTWGFYPGLASNTQTSPLNALLLAGLDRLTGDAVVAALILAAASYLALLALLPALSRAVLAAPAGGLLAFAALLANPLLLSTIGLETLPQVAGLILLLLCCQKRRPLVATIVSAILTLVRPDGVVFALACLIAMPECRRWLLLYGASIAPWFLFSWLRPARHAVHPDGRRRPAERRLHISPRARLLSRDQAARLRRRHGIRAALPAAPAPRRPPAAQ